ncbi:hypothetical protein CRG49_009980 [Neisseria sp. N95_16]|uniref:Uncharacterized protein n=1 Tax=Neisseria brasiliensis TaxID=2666100 RepID=A0A5Q3RZS9_9NEIS|nr:MULTISPECIES: hypothetical protein [Neisseria]MRN38872.1 hypothetical protein [Neisseria brasiliensis]PJO08982.1 hypothetical protein CRG49_009980 [Neisseria sp. N95_16]PJO78278.1 hypothetical protein CWC45_06045 [Neisseria sp. N177_16]QGL24264.1 hypothetical protein GJV52_01095 [Neisseria brasiliensis]
MKTKHILLPLVALFVSATSFAGNDCGVFADACAHGAKLAAKNQATIQKAYDEGRQKVLNQAYDEGRQARIEAIRAKAREQARLEYARKYNTQPAANATN